MLNDNIIRDPDEFPEDVKHLADAIRWVASERKLSSWDGSDNCPTMSVVNDRDVLMMTLPRGCEQVQVNGRVSATQLAFIERWVGVCASAHAALGQRIPQ